MKKTMNEMRAIVNFLVSTNQNELARTMSEDYQMVLSMEVSVVPRSIKARKSEEMTALLTELGQKKVRKNREAGLKKDKAHHGTRGKKMNDPNGSHWTEAHMNRSKRESALRRQVQEDLENWENSVISKADMTHAVTENFNAIPQVLRLSVSEVQLMMLDLFEDYDLTTEMVEFVRTLASTLYDETRNKVEKAWNGILEKRREMEEIDLRIESLERERFSLEDDISRKEFFIFKMGGKTD